MGTLELMDLIIIPFILFVIIGKQGKGILISKRFTIIILFFIFWITLGVLFLPLRYNYPNFKIFYFSILKVAKFTMYVVTGLLIIRVFSLKYFNRYFFSLIVTGLLISISIVYVKLNVNPLVARSVIFSADNVMSAGMCLLLAFLTPFVFKNNFNLFLSTFLKIGFPIMLLGLLLSEGRGGMIAYFISVIYFLRNKFYKLRFSLGILLGVLMIVGFFFMFEEFQYEVLRTFGYSQEYNIKMQKNNAGIGGIDDGKRLSGIIVSIGSVLETPIMGTGFYHRGWKTSLMAAGSHNFWLQMLLETGLVGFLLVINLARNCWIITNRIKSVDYRLSESFKMVLIAAFIVLNSGEYFYAGEALMMFFLLLAPLASYRIKPNFN
jgi:O-antigen ligase